MKVIEDEASVACCWPQRRFWLDKEHRFKPGFSEPAWAYDYDLDNLCTC